MWPTKYYISITNRHQGELGIKCYCFVVFICIQQLRQTGQQNTLLRHEHHQPSRTEANQTRIDQTRLNQTRPNQIWQDSRITKPRTTTRSHTRPKPNLNFKQYLSFYLNSQLYIIRLQQCSSFRQTENLIALFSDEYVDFGGQGGLAEECCMHFHLKNLPFILFLQFLFSV